MSQPFPISQDDVDFAYRAALAHCTGCLDYHMVRPYQVVSMYPYGPLRDAAVFGPMLRDLVPQHGRVFIAGAADAGILSFVLDVVGDRSPAITVADRCETPLLVCRRHAQQRGVTIDTLAADLVVSPPTGRYDLVIAHLILRFIPPDDRVTFLRRLGGAIAPGGHLIVAQLTGDRRGLRTAPEQLASILAERSITMLDPPRVLAAFDRLQARRGEPTKETVDIDGLIRTAKLTIARREISNPEPRAAALMGPSGRARQYLVLEPRRDGSSSRHQ